MIKRAPFAQVTPDGKRMYFRGLTEAIEFEMTRPYVLEKLARMFNAANESDVAERVKEAVEEFRERAINQCEKRAESVRDGACVARQCGIDIRALPAVLGEK